VSTLEHGALTTITGKTDPHAATTVTATRSVFESVMGQRTLEDAMARHEITIVGDAKPISDLLLLLVSFEPALPVVEPGH
jgi:alkyl sulfatase BDS1-like metallo-beta-lactamase superfamily hydrolase